MVSHKYKVVAIKVIAHMSFFCIMKLSVQAQSLDLSDHDFNIKPTTLGGVWERKWDLVDPIYWESSASSSELVQIPDYWISSNRKDYSGHATYKLSLKLPAKSSWGQLGLLFRHFRCAGKVFINDFEVGNIGQVGDDYKSQLGSLLIALPGTQEAIISIQLSNFDYRYGGLAPEILIGRISHLNRLTLVNSGLDSIFAGIILALSLYLFAMFSMHRSNYSYLYLSLICLGVVLRSISMESGSLLLPTLFPDIGWHFWKKIEYLSVYSIVAWFPLYISYIFPAESNRRIVLAFCTLSFTLCTIVILTHHSTYALALDICHAALLVGFINTIYISIKAWKNNNPEAKALLMGILLALPFITLEILKNSTLEIPIQFTHLVESGVLAFLLFQVYILAKRHSFTFKELESLVDMKTRQLTESNIIKDEANKTLEKTLQNLKSTQSQLIQSEKMASLGQLTAGIAHEIQNPLNFVNNFSEVSSELITELHTEIERGNSKDAKEIASDLKQNLDKINHHGNRAADIVKGMLQHSRSSSGQKELTDINALADEYLRLAYHGLHAKDKSFNARFETHLDPALPKVNVVPQDIGRVILNLINNAFYAVTLRRSKGDESYQPTVWVSTQKLNDKILIAVKDNGSGIPDSIKEKIFQPFFTTKPTGQGTGLGLSLSYDIVKAHGGEITMTSGPNTGSEFIIILPV